MDYCQSQALEKDTSVTWMLDNDRREDLVRFDGVMVYLIFVLVSSLAHVRVGEQRSGAHSRELQVVRVHGVEQYGVNGRAYLLQR